MKDTSDSSAINQTLTALDNYVLLGKSGLRVSPLSLGTMGFGNNKETCKMIFDTYHEKGGNFYDTANIYTNGDAERFLGEYVSDKRSECVIATKYSSKHGHDRRILYMIFRHEKCNLLTSLRATNLVNPGALAGRIGRPNPNAGGNHRKNLVETLDGSLKRMGTGYVDVLYVHLWEYRTPISEVMRALDDVVRAAANTMADLRGLTPFIGFQTRYNLLNRSLESDIQPMCADMGIGIVPWSVLAEGFLSGKHTREQKDKDSKRKGMVDSHLKNDKNWRILDEVKAIAQECKKTPAQVAVNWTLQKPGITSPLIGARTLAQLEDNLSALDFTLTKAQMHRLDLVSNPREWPFPQDVARNLQTFTGIGMDIEMPRQFHALQQLRTSKI
ncbi:hypothetical protein EDD11_006967 [Mortierella claussenii]|nr:hypothetical protein EDD11_006967 [Mortierella claussenii]